MNINKKIFRSYDIRGVYPEDINKETAYEIGKAFAEITKAKKVVVGRDMRLGSPDLFEGLLQGLTEQGIDVDDIGLAPIDALYFSVCKYNYDGGVMVTASHNPKEYAGLKMAGKNLNWIRGKDILEILETKQSQHPGTPEPPKTGTVTKKNIYQDYIKHVLSFVDTDKMRPLKIVIDAGNGLAGKVIPLLFKNLPCKVIPLFFELDGNFPNHPSNPLEPESQVAVTKKVLEEQADLGVIMDGDTDRLFFIDEKGNFIRADMTLLVIAKYMLQKYPGSGVAYNAICSKAVPELVTKMGGKPIRSKVGFVNVSTAMKKEGGVVGGELSAHYCFKDNYYADSGFMPLLIVLQILSESEKTFSELVGEFMIYAKSDEVNLEIEDREGVIRKVKERYNDGKQDELDGVTIVYPDWWCNVRPSNTEPLLRAIVEGNTKEILETKKEELITFIKEAAKR